MYCTSGSSKRVLWYISEATFPGDQMSTEINTGEQQDGGWHLYAICSFTLTLKGPHIPGSITPICIIGSFVWEQYHMCHDDQYCSQGKNTVRFKHGFVSVGHRPIIYSYHYFHLQKVGGQVMVIFLKLLCFRIKGSTNKKCLKKSYWTILVSNKGSYFLPVKTHETFASFVSSPGFSSITW